MRNAALAFSAALLLSACGGRIVPAHPSPSRCSSTTTIDYALYLAETRARCTLPDGSETDITTEHDLLATQR